MEDRLPLTEVGGDEILVRVTYQVILTYYREYPELFENPTETLLNLANQWLLADLGAIAEQLVLCAIWVGNGGTVATWRRARIVIHTGRATRLARAGRGPRR